jgi:hypothetical protein
MLASSLSNFLSLSSCISAFSAGVKSDYSFVSSFFSSSVPAGFDEVSIISTSSTLIAAASFFSSISFVSSLG